MNVERRIKRLEELTQNRNKTGCTCIEDILAELDSEEDIICSPEYGAALEAALGGIQ